MNQGENVQKFSMTATSMPGSAWDFIVELLVSAQDSNYETPRTRFLASEIFEHIETTQFEVAGDDPFDLWDDERDCPKGRRPVEDSQSD